MLVVKLHQEAVHRVSTSPPDFVFFDRAKYNQPFYNAKTLEKHELSMQHCSSNMELSNDNFFSFSDSILIISFDGTENELTLECIRKYL